MLDFKKNIRIALAQVSPVIMNKDETIKKAIKIIENAGKEGSNLVVFPESFIPAYPRGFSYGFVVGSRTMEGRKDWKKYYDNSVVVGTIDTELLCEAAKKASIYVSIGITERDAINSTLYCTNLIIDPDGNIISSHRKLKPTGTERCIWGEGNGSTLDAVTTPYGVMGSLICWENYMPLARFAMYEQGVSIYLAPTADSRDEWQSTVRHISLEGRCFVISCNQFVTKDMYPTDLNLYDELESQPDIMCRGGSCVIDPFGKYVVEPIWDKEDVVYCDLNLDMVALSRIDFDPAGHYNRPDVFEFNVNKK
ncbi:MAG: carbon-nitrogen hydrolase family protein [Gudongella sp.]|nr:carbon-nitrogen hydrolase family protein [Gudongella sp.]